MFYCNTGEHSYRLKDTVFNSIRLFTSFLQFKKCEPFTADNGSLSMYVLRMHIHAWHWGKYDDLICRGIKMIVHLLYNCQCQFPHLLKYLHCQAFLFPFRIIKLSRSYIHPVILEIKTISHLFLYPIQLKKLVFLLLVVV